MGISNNFSPNTEWAIPRRKRILATTTNSVFNMYLLKGSHSHGDAYNSVFMFFYMFSVYYGGPTRLTLELDYGKASVAFSTFLGKDEWEKKIIY